MKKITLLFLIICCCFTMTAQTQSPWTVVNSNSNSAKVTSQTIADQQLRLQLNMAQLRGALNIITDVKGSSTTILMPNASGVMEEFQVWESSNFAPELQLKYSAIRAYAGKGITDPTASLHFSLSDNDVQTMVLRGDKESEFIEPTAGDKKYYSIVTATNRTLGMLPMICTTEDITINKKIANTTARASNRPKVFKTLRLALSCTGEYSTYFGGTVVNSLAAMNATMSRVNGIFNKDLSLQLNLIADTEKLIYLDANVDPYSDADRGADGAWALELQENLTKVITNAGYDIGHLLGASGGGGNAGCIGCVCDAPTSIDPYGKGSGYTSPSDRKPEGDSFDVDFVAHEMGHQLGANHTFSYEIEGTGVSVEPGSGTTIMGYAGIAAGYNVQNSSDDYFTHASIVQIQENLDTKDCPVITAIATAAPDVDAGKDYSIPKGTAFILKGSATSTNSGLTYTWEQNDSAVNTDGDASFAVPTKLDGPLFRSLPPSATAIRYMPLYSDVLNNRLTTSWESVASVARKLHFVLTVRDNASLGKAQTNYDDATVNVLSTAGPFEVLSQDSNEEHWLRGQSKRVKWAVNNTNTIEGAANVNIKLSIDGGLTFPIVLAANTPNDGSEDIIVPAVTAKQCRVLIEPTDNIFYALNKSAFAIGYQVTNECANFPFTAATATEIPEGLGYRTFEITVPATTAVVADVNFNVAFTHQYLSDVDMQVVSPSGTTVVLFNRDCGDDNGSLSIAYDDDGGALSCGSSTLQTVAPAEALSVFNGEPAAGKWLFKVRDSYTSDTGMIDTASIGICTKDFALDTTDLTSEVVYAYPNPTRGEFTVKFISKGLNPIVVKLFNATGQNVFEKEFNKQTTFIEDIQLNNVASGIYFLKLTDGDKEEVRKIIIY